ncbi:MAG: hypothetical protein M3Q31_07950 [Actinomycetota bacterium]|nr:hypothetical protein [Actinomycetota bacterium]
MIALPVSCAAIGAILSFTPLARTFGFAALPIAFFLILLGMLASYLVLVEFVKARFYAVQARSQPASPTHEERRHRHIRRRARGFTLHAKTGRTIRTS